MILLPTLLHRETVTVIDVTFGEPDDYGVPTTTHRARTWAGVNIQKLTATELNDAGRDTTIDTWRIAGPPITITGDATIVWDGTVYDVDATPDTRQGEARIGHTALTIIKHTG